MKTKLFLLLAICLTAFNVNAQNPTVVSITGEAQGGWAANNNPQFDTDMTSVDGENWTLASFTCANAAADGGIKFRANHSWDFPAGIWGSTAFPTGTGANPGDNILCTAGNWSVTFNSTTGAYVFAPGVVLPVVKVKGTAVTPSTGVAMSITSGSTFAVTTNLVAGNAQFDIDNTTGGGTVFPDGTITGATDNIPVPTAGNYKITVNTDTGEYKFMLIPVYPTIALVGAGAGGWPTGAAGEVDVNQMATSAGVDYKINNVALTLDNVKFRADNAWATSWGGSAFPTGTPSGSNILVTTAGNYRAKLNRLTGDYNFDFPSIALVGPAAGGWPTGAAGEVDAVVLTTTDGLTYTKNSIVLVNGAAKFRYDNAWSDSTGGASWPTATAGNGTDIVAVAGTYSITLNRATGAYTFGAPILANANFTAKTFKVSPNPSSTNWEIVSGNSDITSVQIVNVLGKVVYSNNVAANKIVVDASDLSTGLYFAKVSSANATETIKLIKN